MKKLLLFVLPVLFFIFSCSREEITAPPVPQPEQVLTLSAALVNGGASAFEKSVSIKTEADWTVSIPDSIDWISVSPMSGSGDSTIKISVAENTGADQRIGVLTVNANDIEQTITVVQASDKSLSVSETDISMDYHAFDSVIQITTSGQWAINTTQLPDWITISNAIGTGSEEITVSVAENKTGEQRITDIEVSTTDKTETITITQGAHPLNIPVTNVNTDFKAVNDTVVVDGPEGWTVGNASGSWFTATQLGDTAVKIVLEKNYDAAQRTGTFDITAGGTTTQVTVTQEGNPALDVTKPITMNLTGSYLQLSTKIDYLEVASNTAFDIPAGQSFSVSFKMKITDILSSNSRIFGRRFHSAGPGYELFIQKTTGHLGFNLSDNNNQNIGSNMGSTDINDGKWHHIAVVYDAANKETYIYVDGTKEAVRSFSSITPVDVSLNNPLLIGDSWPHANPSDPAWPIAADIDDFHCWNIALPQKAVYADAADIALPENSNNLIAGWDFENVSGTTVSDMTGNGHDGDLVNGAAIGQ